MTSTDFILDTSAIIEAMQETERGKRIEKLIGSERCFVTPFTIAETISVTLRNKGNTELALRAILDRCVVIETRSVQGYDTGLFHAVGRRTNPKLSYGDAAVIAAADLVKGTIVSCDADFKGFTNAIVVE
jgi:predicted nucleic acid-binding protein